MNIFLLYMLIINIVTFSVRGIDKRKASKEKRRVSEKNLLLLTLAGGWLGAVAGVQYFKHKTIKTSFAWKLRTLVVIWIIISFVVMYYTQQSSI